MSDLSWLNPTPHAIAVYASRPRHAHYRPKDRPNAVRVLHSKTGEENWIPLFDDAGAPLYPELMAELDALKRDRIGGLMLRRLGRARAMAERERRSRPDFSDGAEDHPRRGAARRAIVYELPSRRVHRIGRRRSHRRRDQGPGTPPLGARAAALCQADHETGCRRGEERRSTRTEGGHLSE
jgi:hypothetical protein